MNNNNKHTPGPWENHGWRVDIGGNTITLATPGITTEEADANAALIAAAPELLAALEMFKANFESSKGPTMTDCISKMYLAIKKAKGE